MDRSFLSDKKVISVSRKFVCIRTATYEDEIEAEFLKRTFGGRPGGGLRNFGFCVLSPDGKRVLKRSNRGPNFTYVDSNAMAEDLQRLANQFSEKIATGGHKPPVPRMKSVRLGINVASCDGLPCVAVFGRNHAEVDRLNRKLRDVIWDEEVAGKFIYASTTNSNDLKIVSGAKARPGFLIIKPDAYGTQGQLIELVDMDASTGQLRKALLDSAVSYVRLSKNHRTHVRTGHRLGTYWKTEVPVPESRSPNNRRLNRGGPGGTTRD